MGVCAAVVIKLVIGVTQRACLYGEGGSSREGRGVASADCRGCANLMKPSWVPSRELPKKSKAAALLHSCMMRPLTIVAQNRLQTIAHSICPSNTQHGQIGDAKTCFPALSGSAGLCPAGTPRPRAHQSSKTAHSIARKQINVWSAAADRGRHTQRRPLSRARRRANACARARVCARCFAASLLRAHAKKAAPKERTCKADR